MARKKKTTTTTTTSSGTSNWGIVKLCAYWGLVIAAVAAILSFIFGLLVKCGVHIDWAGTLIKICSSVSQIALIIAAIIPAYYYCRGKTAPWRAFFWVAVIFIVLGLIGINLAF